VAQRSPKPVTAPPLPETLTVPQRERRERIIEAGLALLRHQDHTQIQMRDVAERADVALGTVYRYFQSKDHLFAEVLAAWARRLRTNVERHPLRGATNVDRLTDVLHRSVRAFQVWPQLARVVMALESSSDPFTQEIFARNNGENRAVYTEALQDLPPDITDEVIRIAGAVLDLQLRQWVVGHHSIAEVYDRLDQAVKVILLFREPQAPEVPVA
jgi:AcrR family transcriptional regulator